MTTANTRDTFVLFNEQIRTGMWEALDTNVNGFNAASAGAITLRSDSVTGTYARRAFFDRLSDDAFVRRNPSSNSDVDSIDLTMDEFVAINLARRIGPIDKTLESWRAMGSDPGELSIVVGRQIGELKAKKMLNTALIGLRASLTAQVSLTHDITGLSTDTLNTRDLAKGQFKLGDAFSNIVAWAMHSTAYAGLTDSQIADKMDSVAGVIVYGGSPATFGKPVIVTDSSALVDELTAGNIYYTLGLTAGAADIVDSNQSDIVSSIVDGKENLTGRVQGESTLQLGIKGCAWDVTNGGVNPTDATLATTAYWLKKVASVKNMGGVVIKHN